MKPNAIIVAAGLLLVGIALSACSSDYLDPKLPDGTRFSATNGYDPISGASASLGDMEKCWKHGGVKQRSSGGPFGGVGQPVQCVN